MQEQDGLKEKRETPAHFVERATVIAKEVQKVYGVPWQATVLTACLESGYGKHAPNNNYFGIKSAGRKGRYWRGDSGSFQTREFLNGRSVTMRDGFRAYDNMIDSFFDYGEFLTTNARYAKAFHYKNDPKRFLEEIIRAGYATDPDYVQKVTSIARRYGISLNTSDYRLA